MLLGKDRMMGQDIGGKAGKWFILYADIDNVHLGPKRKKKRSDKAKHFYFSITTTNRNKINFKTLDFVERDQIVVHLIKERQRNIANARNTGNIDNGIPNCPNTECIQDPYPSPATNHRQDCNINIHPSNQWRPSRFVKSGDTTICPGPLAEFDHCNLTCPPPIGDVIGPALSKLGRHGYSTKRTTELAEQVKKLKRKQELRNRLREIERQELLEKVEAERFPDFPTETQISNARRRWDECWEGMEDRVFYTRNDSPVKYPIFTPGAKVIYDISIGHQEPPMKSEQLLPAEDIQDGKCIIDVLPQVNKDLRYQNLLRWAATDPYSGLVV